MSGAKSELVENIERAIAPVLRKLGDLEYRLDKMGTIEGGGGGGVGDGAPDRSKSKSKSRTMSMMSKSGDDAAVGDLDPVMTGTLIFFFFLFFFLSHT
jgi:hypothetical protein